MNTAISNETNASKLQQQLSRHLMAATSSVASSSAGVANTGREEPTDFQKSVFKKNLHSIKLPFPYKVHEMLEHVEKENKNHIVSWLPHGKSFRVHMEKEFVNTIMPLYFNQSKFTSFTRQLYIYGFQKVQEGPDKGAFSQKLFLRSNKSLCLSMKRKRDKPLPKPKKPLRRTAMMKTPSGGFNTCQSASMATARQTSSRSTQKFAGNSPYLAGTQLSLPRHSSSSGAGSSWMASGSSLFHQTMQSSLPSTRMETSLQGSNPFLPGIKNASTSGAAPASAGIHACGAGTTSELFRATDNAYGPPFAMNLSSIDGRHADSMAYASRRLSIASVSMPGESENTWSSRFSIQMQNQAENEEEDWLSKYERVIYGGGEQQQMSRENDEDQPLSLPWNILAASLPVDNGTAEDVYPAGGLNFQQDASRSMEASIAAATTWNPGQNNMVVGSQEGLTKIDNTRMNPNWMFQEQVARDQAQRNKQPCKNNTGLDPHKTVKYLNNSTSQRIQRLSAQFQFEGGNASDNTLSSSMF